MIQIHQITGWRHHRSGTNAPIRRAVLISLAAIPWQRRWPRTKQLILLAVVATELRYIQMRAVTNGRSDAAHLNGDTVTMLHRRRAARLVSALMGEVDMRTVTNGGADVAHLHSDSVTMVHGSVQASTVIVAVGAVDAAVVRRVRV